MFGCGGSRDADKGRWNHGEVRLDSERLCGYGHHAVLKGVKCSEVKCIENVPN